MSRGMKNFFPKQSRAIHESPLQDFLIYRLQRAVREPPLHQSFFRIIRTSRAIQPSGWKRPQGVDVHFPDFGEIAEKVRQRRRTSTTDCMSEASTPGASRSGPHAARRSSPWPPGGDGATRTRPPRIPPRKFPQPDEDHGTELLILAAPRDQLPSPGDHGLDENPFDRGIGVFLPDPPDHVLVGIRDPGFAPKVQLHSPTSDL